MFLFSNVGNSARVSLRQSLTMTTYRIKKGDTLSGIARRYGTTTLALAKANHFRNANVISAGRTLTVPGHSTKSSFTPAKKTTKKIVTIAQELGVGAVLEGSVRRAGQRVRIVVHLVDPRTENHLWGETFDRQLSDIFEVQSEVAHQISGALAVALSPEEKQRVEKKATGSAEAYNLYLLGRFHSNKRSGADVQRGIEYYQEAIARDPAYAVAYAGIADAYELLSIGFGAKPPVEYLADAKAMALKALEMDETLAEAHTSLAYARW